MIDNLEKRLASSASADSRLQLRGGSPLRAYLQLIRLPNVLTAMADPAMGFLFVRPVDQQWDSWREPAALAMLVAVSSLLYIGGVALNDLLDFPIDRRARPERPLPSGRVPPIAALGLGTVALGLGLLAACVAAWLVGNVWPLAVAAALTMCIVAYDGWLKHTVLGPATMGACRALSAVLGVTASDGPIPADGWLVAAVLGVYVAGITWFARRESGRAPRWPLAFSTLVMAVGLASLVGLPLWSDRTVVGTAIDPVAWYACMSLLGAAILGRCVWAIAEPVPTRVRVAVARAVLSLVLLDATVVFAVGHVLGAIAIVSLVVPAFLLSRYVEMA